MKKILSILLLSAVMVGSSLLFVSTGMAERSDEHVSDTWLEAKLTTVYALNSELSIFDIDVDVKDQVTYLTGVVESEVEKDLATEIAKSVDGVKDVENSIQVAKEKSEHQTNKNAFFQSISDLTTTASIKTALLSNAEISGWKIGVSTDQNIVTLDGKVPTSKHSALAEQIAKNTEGVADVKNNLTIDAKS